MESYQICIIMILAWYEANLSFCNLAFQDGRHLPFLKTLKTWKWQYLKNCWVDFDQICVKWILEWIVSKLNKIDQSSWLPLLKIAKCETKKISMEWYQLCVTLVLAWSQLIFFCYLAFQDGRFQLLLKLAQKRKLTIFQIYSSCIKHLSYHQNSVLSGVLTTFYSLCFRTKEPDV